MEKTREGDDQEERHARSCARTGRTGSLPSELPHLSTDAWRALYVHLFASNLHARLEYTRYFTLDYTANYWHRTQSPETQQPHPIQKKTQIVILAMIDSYFTYHTTEAGFRETYRNEATCALRCEFDAGWKEMSWKLCGRGCLHSS